MLKAGSKFITNNWGEVEVVKYNNALNVEIVWSDGTKSSASSESLRRGTVAHPSYGFLKDKQFTSNCGWTFKIVEYKSAHDVIIEWQDGSQSSEVSSGIRTGTIKPLTKPSVEGIGYFGYGDFTPASYTPTSKTIDKRVYAFWVRMFSRCYNPSELNKPRNANYRNVHVRSDWHNFQTFAKWAYEQPYVFEIDAELDKDLLGDSMLYSAENCTILPSTINKFLLDAPNGKYPRGVNVVRPKTLGSNYGYVARCSVDGDREYLGFFSTPEQAFLAYKSRKEDYGRELAERYKDKITLEAYVALLNVEIKPF